MIKVIILDFDGVIVESVDIKTEAFRELFQEYPNVNEIVEYHLRHNAISRYIKFEYIYQNLLGKDYNEEIKEELGRKFSEIVFQKIVTCPFVAGAEEFLKTFSRTHPMYLISATPHEELKRIIHQRNLQGYFREVWGIPPGNKVDFMNQVLKRENVRAEEAVYIGDMREDFKVAQEVGVPFVGRKNKESFDDLDAPVFPDMVGIMAWVKNSAEA